MTNQDSGFNRIFLIVLALLYLLSLGSFTYANWRLDTEHNVWNHALNALILSLPLILFFGAIYVLVNAWREHRQTGQINPRLAKIIHWAPRAAAVVIIFFITLFSLDVFDMGGTPLQMIGAFLMHSLPSIVMIILLAFAWRRPVVGFVAFLLGGIFFLRFVIRGFDLGNFILFSGPLLLTSALFFVDWRWNRPVNPAPLDAVI